MRFTCKLFWNNFKQYVCVCVCANGKMGAVNWKMAGKSDGKILIYRLKRKLWSVYFLIRIYSLENLFPFQANNSAAHAAYFDPYIFWHATKQKPTTFSEWNKNEEKKKRKSGSFQMHAYIKIVSIEMRIQIHWAHKIYFFGMSLKTH